MLYGITGIEELDYSDRALAHCSTALGFARG